MKARKAIRQQCNHRLGFGETACPVELSVGETTRPRISVGSPTSARNQAGTSVDGCHEIRDTRTRTPRRICTRPQGIRWDSLCCAGTREILQRLLGQGLNGTIVSIAGLLADLKARGVEKMGIDWTNLIAFYEQLGFEVWKRYWQCEKG